MFQPRRQRLRALLNRQALPLFDLADAEGCPPDFLNPRADSVEEGIDAIRSTPPAIVRAQLEQVIEGPKIPAWIQDLARGNRHTCTMLVRSLVSTYKTVIRNDAELLCDDVERDLSHRRELMATHGLEAVLESLPHSHWTGDALHTADGWELPPDFSMSGQRLVLSPSATRVDPPQMWVRRDGGHIVLVYAALDLRCPTGRGGDDDPLVPLIGATRARILRLLAHPHTTTELARAARVSIATASEHVKVLREAGLVTSCRDGSAVQHSRTALGQRLAAG